MLKNRNNPNLGQAIRVFGHISGWIVGPIVLAVLVGNWLDNKQGTDKKMLFISMGIAFVLTIIGVAIEMRKYIKQVEKEDALKKSHDNGTTHNGN